MTGTRPAIVADWPRGRVVDSGPRVEVLGSILSYLSMMVGPVFVVLKGIFRTIEIC